jgi:hypothetical protein
MQQLLETDRVRLEQDIPELQLHRGQVGVVVSSWFVRIPPMKSASLKPDTSLRRSASCCWSDGIGKTK